MMDLMGNVSQLVWDIMEAADIYILVRGMFYPSSRQLSGNVHVPAPGDA